MRVCIEGLMGSGKSTFCEYVGDYVPEPVLGGTGIGFIRELRYLLARKRNWRSFGSSGGDTYYYYDRSLWSSGVFWLPEYSYGHLSYDELDLLHSTKEAILRDADLPDVVVWFRASVLTCARRLGERGDYGRRGRRSLRRRRGARCLHPLWRTRSTHSCPPARGR